MKNSPHRIIGVLASLILAISACSAPTVSTPQGVDKQVQVTDDAGRTITFDEPVDEIVVANRYNSELIRAMGHIEKVVSVDTNTAQDRAYWSQFDPDNVIGKGQSNLNIEKIISLHPDALVLPKNADYESYAEQLEPAGIKVVVVTGWDNKALDKQIDILGQLFNDKPAAEELIKFYEETLALVKERVEKAPERKTVYWEYGGPFTTAFPGTSNDGWHNMIVNAGGVNIFADQPATGDTVDPEYILQTNPDLILKVTSGGALKNTGVYTPPADTEFPSIAEEMMARPGWNNLNAVANDQLYFMTGFLGGGLGKAIGTVYVAKWLYPEQMADVNPDDFFNRWLELQNAKPVDGHTYHAHH